MTDVEFVEKYKNLCGHIAQDFVGRSRRDNVINPLSQEDAKDFASVAMLRLVKCPIDKRDQKNYVVTLIVNGIITAWRKRLKTRDMEGEPSPRIVGALLHQGIQDGYQISLYGETDFPKIADVFDRLPGRDGLAAQTELQHDFQKVSSLVPHLPDSERIVMELNFGLNGCEPHSIKRISKKLGRSTDWVERRLNKSILRIREKLSFPTPVSAV